MKKLFFASMTTRSLLLGGIFALTTVVGLMSAPNANAQSVTFDFQGTVTSNPGGFFGGKLAGETFSGSFTVDPSAPQTGGGGPSADYDGSFFSFTVEGDSYLVSNFTVWSSSPDGVEFDTVIGSTLGFLALRSSSNIYATNAIPNSYDINDFDVNATVSFIGGFPNFAFSTGEITSITPRGTPPTVSCPLPVTSECNAPSSRDVTLSVDIDDEDGDPLDVEWFVNGNSEQLTIGTLAATDSFTHTFGLGTTTVDVIVSDGIEDPVSCTTTVTVIDSTDPVAICSADVVAGNDPGLCEASGIALPPPAVTDNCEVASLTNDAPPTFPVGVTIVTWTVTDVGGNTAMCTQTVTVNDTEDPTITCPPDVTVNHDTGGCTATGVSLGAPVTGDNCGVDSVTNDAPLEYPAGDTYVTWTVIDTSGNQTQCLQKVTVLNQDPVANAGMDQLLECTSSAGVEATLDGTASYDPDAADTISYQWSAVGITFDDDTSDTPTAMFPMGSTTVTLVVTDQCGGMDSTDVIIVVEDNTAPQIEVIFADKQTLWPPNHKMVPVHISIGVRDTCANPDQLVVSCVARSNEPDNGNGDGNTTGDVDGQDGYANDVPITMTWNAVTEMWEGSLELRAERDGTNAERKYSVDCLVGDLSGNITNATLCVVVPKKRNN